MSLLRDALRFGYGSTNVWLYVVRRLLLLVPQVLAVTTIVFFLNRLLPGDPAYMIAGSLATKDVVASVRKQMELDLPIWDQYLAYLGRVAHGDLGKSWLTSSQVTDDILQRLPATLELISLALLLALLIALPLGMLTALRPGSLVDRVASAYGMLAGAMPDFWWALFLIFVLFGQLQIVPAPIGRIDLALLPPPQVTGFYTIELDSQRATGGHFGLLSATWLFLPSLLRSSTQGRSSRWRDRQWRKPCLAITSNMPEQADSPNGSLPVTRSETRFCR